MSKNINNDCHSLTNVSEEIRNLTKMPYLANAQGMTRESGRSMVEMLGVLAIIGVLSVAGITGFKTAMTRHQANELLNEASKRAVVLAAQFSAGKTKGNLSEFNNTLEYVVFDDNALLINDNQFRLTLTGIDGNKIDTAICSQLKKMQGNNTPIRAMADDCSFITYNKDLSTTIYPSDYNGNKEKCEGMSNTIYCSNFDICIEKKASVDDYTNCQNVFYEETSCNLAEGVGSGQTDGKCEYLNHDLPECYQLYGTKKCVRSSECRLKIGSAGRYCFDSDKETYCLATKNSGWYWDEEQSKCVCDYACPGYTNQCMGKKGEMTLEKLNQYCRCSGDYYHMYFWDEDISDCGEVDSNTGCAKNPKYCDKSPNSNCKPINGQCTMG